MKIKSFQLRGNNSVCAGAFQSLCGRAPAQLRGNIGWGDRRKRSSRFKLAIPYLHGETANQLEETYKLSFLLEISTGSTR
jgi:hypothetical protein